MNFESTCCEKCDNELEVDSNGRLYCVYHGRDYTTHPPPTGKG